VEDVWLVDGIASLVVCSSKKVAEAWAIVVEGEEGIPPTVYAKSVVTAGPTIFPPENLGFRFKR
jgi:hypothetical protein